MSDKDPHKNAPGGGRRYWLEQPGNVGLIWRGLVVVCVFLFLVDFFVEKHPYFGIERLPNFYGFFGFFACTFLVLAATQLRKVLMRDEDYYERSDAESAGAVPSAEDEKKDAH